MSKVFLEKDRPQTLTGHDCTLDKRITRVADLTGAGGYVINDMAIGQSAA